MGGMFAPAQDSNEDRTVCTTRFTWKPVTNRTNQGPKPQKGQKRENNKEGQSRQQWDRLSYGGGGEKQRRSMTNKQVPNSILIIRAVME